LPVRWQITGGKNCRFAEAVPLKIFLHQMVASKNRLSPQIDKNVEDPFQCRFAAFAIRRTKQISRSSVKPSSAFQENLRYSFFTQLDGDQECRGLSDVAAWKEIVDF
jgi:hypothetical protein